MCRSLKRGCKSTYRSLKATPSTTVALCEKRTTTSVRVITSGSYLYDHSSRVSSLQLIGHREGAGVTSVGIQLITDLFSVHLRILIILWIPMELIGTKPIDASMQWPKPRCWLLGSLKAISQLKLRRQLCSRRMPFSATMEPSSIIILLRSRTVGLGLAG